jgi:hypothetical protein
MSKKTSTKPTPNAPAPGLPEAAADVMATEAAPAASPATASTVAEGEQSSSGDQALSPLGEGITADAVTAPVNGDLLPPLGVVAVIVTSEVEGFRRAGRAWSRTPTTVAIEEMTLAAIAALEAEPLLQVVYVADNAEKAAG